MARGTALSVLRSMLKAEIGHNLQTGVAAAQDTELNQLLADQQELLWSEHQWRFLYTHEDIAMVANTRYYTAWSTVSFDLGFSKVEVKWGRDWIPVAEGISGEQYERVDPDLNQTRDPVERWQYNTADGKIEVWPVPSTSQTLRFWGQKVLGGFKTAGSFDDTKTADLDDLMIVLFAAAQKLKRMKQADWQDKLAQATKRLNTLRSVNLPDPVFVMSRDDFDRSTPRQSRRVVTAISNPNH